MNTSKVNPGAAGRKPGQETGPSAGPASGSAVLRRPVEGSMVAGVAAGLARYGGVDVVFVRIAFVVLALFSGTGIPLYLAGLLLIPEEGSGQSVVGSLTESLRSRSR